MRLLSALLALAAFAAPPLPTIEEYQKRRAALRTALPDAAIVLHASSDRSGDPRVPLIQEPNFFYLTGWTEPGAVLLLLPKGSQPEEILFLPPRNERKERYEGRHWAAGDKDVETKSGFAKVMSTGTWEDEFKRLAAKCSKVYALKPSGGAWKTLPVEREVLDATGAIARLRMVKSQTEIDLLQHAIDVTARAHLAAWKRAKAGLYEYQIEATMTEVMQEAGCKRHAYRPVIGSGPNSVILHYGANRRRMDSGEMLVADVGAECSDYAADITRSIPVNGKFNPRQREIYELVLGAQKAAIAAVRPGEMLVRGALVEAAKQYMDKHGKPINGKPPSTYFVHGIGHHVGLEVHDATAADVPLEPGNVITIEPGMYIPEENFGVRIEDMVLVTEKGGIVLSRALPREIAQIEKRMR
ncbi:MAG: aminopeptidase P family protein [Candidatus Solibacter usitatus]|nr:aminopeptidase P family protein [Candidatus Solibacter usitatus]